ncbi:MAG: glycosyltransferase family 4 protein [Synechococcaceae cyanobacterium SM1_2_3]|nr:glycosyltransferase family 4 protein [Synechococcaceae cyanobacterium SM1_2_3]
MRIAYLCKRHYMNHDVIADRYARLYEQPRQLALLGHDVLGLCLSYRRTDERNEVHEAGSGHLRWVGLAPGSLLPVGIAAYPKRALAELREFAPDVLVAASDAPHIVLGAWLAQRLGLPFAADIYDHFESFGLARLPGVIPLYRRALRNAAVVSCVSQPLANLVCAEYGARGEVLALPSTIDRSIFFPRHQRQCRQRLGLPLEARLIGTAGGLSREKGIAPLYEAFTALAQDDAQLHLVLAGSLDKNCMPPPHPRVRYLGQLPHTQTAELFSALDVGVVYVRNTPYGIYSFPQKALEMAACGLALAVARVGAMETMFANTPQALYDADDAIALAACLRHQLNSPARSTLKIMDWAEQAEVLSASYAKAVRGIKSTDVISADCREIIPSRPENPACAFPETPAPLPAIPQCHRTG